MSMGRHRGMGGSVYKHADVAERMADDQKSEGEKKHRAMMYLCGWNEKLRNKSRLEQIFPISFA